MKQGQRVPACSRLQGQLASSEVTSEVTSGVTNGATPRPRRALASTGAPPDRRAPRR